MILLQKNVLEYFLHQKQTLAVKGL